MAYFWPRLSPRNCYLFIKFLLLLLLLLRCFGCLCFLLVFLLLLLLNVVIYQHTYIAYMKYFLHEASIIMPQKFNAKSTRNTKYFGCLDTQTLKTHPQCGNWLAKYAPVEKRCQQTMWNCATDSIAPETIYLCRCLTLSPSHLAVIWPHGTLTAPLSQQPLQHRRQLKRKSFLISRKSSVMQSFPQFLNVAFVGYANWLTKKLSRPNILILI